MDNTTTSTSGSVLTATQKGAIRNSLTSFGNSILDTFIDLLPAMALIAAVFFVIGIIRSKVN